MEELSSRITIEPLSPILNPVKKLPDIISNIFELVYNPIPQLWTIQMLCEYRLALEELSPTATRFNLDMDILLDRGENRLIYRRCRTYWDYRSKAWSLFYSASRCSELINVSFALRKAAFGFASLQKQWIKIWGFTFGDYVFERSKGDFGEYFFEGAKKAEHSWKQTVRECFLIGYSKANSFSRERGTQILKQLIIDLFFSSIGAKVEEFLLSPKGQLRHAMEPISKAIRSPVNELLDMDNIARESINKILMDCVTAVVERDVITPFLEQYSQV